MCLAHTLAFHSDWHMLMGCIAVVPVTSCLLQLPEIESRPPLSAEMCANWATLFSSQRFPHCLLLYVQTGCVEAEAAYLVLRCLALFSQGRISIVTKTT